MLQWAIELSEYRIEYQLRLSMKGHVMADFVVESPQRSTRDGEPYKEEWWTLRVDGASRSSGSGVGLLLQSPTGEQLEQAILSGLDLTLVLSVSKLRIYSDSQLIVRHIQEEYGAKDERMTRYLTKVRDTLQWLGKWTIEKIPRADNVRADALAGIAASLPVKEAILLPIYVQTNPSITEASTCNTIEDCQEKDQEWTKVIAEYLRTGSLPDEPKQTHKIRVQAARFALIGERLYKRFFTSPYLKCLDRSEA
ncbi:hypothetical protein VitviT2T_014164 [Vitis vinifera]|uniref:RNase H type-1 domain-containing protein n=1 Tax=Vitis vinifera TaxID=29760 RepID=A0ABY9CN19_VITVI|nr:hypothetical protein VitviT2T_014164 [Vitis vinifera]